MRADALTMLYSQWSLTQLLGFALMLALVFQGVRCLLRVLLGIVLVHKSAIWAFVGTAIVFLWLANPDYLQYHDVGIQYCLLVKYLWTGLAAMGLYDLVHHRAGANL